MTYTHGTNVRLDISDWFSETRIQPLTNARIHFVGELSRRDCEKSRMLRVVPDKYRYYYCTKCTECVQLNIRILVYVKLIYGKEG